MAAHICYYSTPLRHLLDSYSSSTTTSSPYTQLHLSAPNHLSHSLRGSTNNLNLTDARKVSLQIVPIKGLRERNLTMNCQSTMEQKPISQDRMLVFVPPHPLIKHWVSVLRNEETPTPIFNLGWKPR